MKKLMLALLLAGSASAIAMDAPSKFMNDTLTAAEQIIALKSTSAQQTQLCALIKKSVDLNSVGTGLLGNYASLASDKTGVDAFIKLVPSILVTKIMPSLSQAAQGSFTVGDTATDNGDGTYSVDVTVATAQGSYDGSAIVEASGGSFLLLDGQYLGFSAVSYFGSNIQQQVSTAESTDPTTPVSDVDKQISSQSGFITCN